MLIRLFSLVLAALLLGGAAPQTTDGLLGEWRNTRDTVRLRVAPCGQGLCGTVFWATETARADARKGSGRDLIGNQILRDLRQRPDGTWRGKVHIPDINTTGSATVTQLNPSTLRVSGCLFAGLACRTQHWHRIG